MATFEMVTVDPPVLVIITGKVLLPPPVDTLPKFKVLLLALLLSCPGEVTVRVAAELVALPAELVTTTLKVEPLSEVAVAGVV
jgi:hypothetical protein